MNDEREKFDKTKYINKFQKENYDRIIVQVKKGEREHYKEQAKEKGYTSLNAYIINLMDNDKEKSKG